MTVVRLGPLAVRATLDSYENGVLAMRVLITGGGGFLGAAVARALVARGDTAIAFDTQLASLATAGPDERLIRVPGDVTDMANVAHAVKAHRPDAVVHGAAIVGVLSSLGSPINVIRVNVEGSLNVFEAMRLGGVRRCIHISSEEAYGAFKADRIDETHALDPVLPYGICKAAVEQLGRSYGDLHGLEVINLRTSWVYGPGLPRNRIPKNLVDAARPAQAPCPGGCGLGDRPYACRRLRRGCAEGARPQAAPLRRLQHREWPGDNGRRADRRGP